jgi:uncharacterized membrane protein YedE/YeeE
MEEFTPFSSLLGGALIGVSASLLLAADGKIAGVSGILGGVLEPRRGDTAWRVVFLVGLVSGGFFVQLLAPEALRIAAPRSLVVYGVAGLLVGYGTRLGNGCTSGHGVCGLSRGSKRSLVATLSFMAAGAITVYLARHVWGGLP